MSGRVDLYDPTTCVCVNCDACIVGCLTGEAWVMTLAVELVHDPAAGHEMHVLSHAALCPACNRLLGELAEGAMAKLPPRLRALAEGETRLRASLERWAARMRGES